MRQLQERPGGARQSMRKRDAFTAVCRSAAVEDKEAGADRRAAGFFAARNAPRRVSARESPVGIPVIDEKTPGVHSPPAEARQQKMNESWLPLKYTLFRDQERPRVRQLQEIHQRPPAIDEKTSGVYGRLQKRSS